MVCGGRRGKLGRVLRGALVALLLVAECPILGILVLGALLTRPFSSMDISSLRTFLGFEHRWRVLVPVVVAGPASLGVSLWLVANKSGPNVLADQTPFFQVAAQVIAALLVTMALTTQAGSNRQARCVRPVLGWAVVFAGVGELAAVSALVFSASALPVWWQRALFSLAVTGGLTALMAVVLAGRRLLGEEG